MLIWIRLLDYLRELDDCARVRIIMQPCYLIYVNMHAQEHGCMYAYAQHWAVYTHRNT